MFRAASILGIIACAWALGLFLQYLTGWSWYYFLALVVAYGLYQGWVEAKN